MQQLTVNVPLVNLKSAFRVNASAAILFRLLQQLYHRLLRRRLLRRLQLLPCLLELAGIQAYSFLLQVARTSLAVKENKLLVLVDFVNVYAEELDPLVVLAREEPLRRLLRQCTSSR
jgi:hypothetical protein